jgi:uncharacterized integral membrane protein
VTEPHTSSARHDAGRTLRIVIAALVVTALGAVAFDNREEVRVGYVIGDANAPVWLVLIAAGVAGIVVGWLIKHRPRRD